MLRNSESIRNFMRKKFGADSILERGSSTPIPQAPATDLTQTVQPNATETGEVNSLGTGKSESQIIVEALASRLSRVA